MKFKNDLISKLNLNISKLTNMTVGDGYYDFPTLYCNISNPPDYIALYSQPCDYHHTENTALSFYDYDDKFDGENGLYNAIYYNKENRLDYFKTRFSGIKYFILPDYSICGDIQTYRNLHRIGRAREVGIWLSTNLKAHCLPNIGVCDEKTLSIVLDGLKNVNAIAFSTKGKTSKEDLELLQLSIDKAINELINLEYIIVYDVSSDNKKIDILFSKAIKKGIKVIVPNNLLKTRNRILSNQRAKCVQQDIQH